MKFKQLIAASIFATSLAVSFVVNPNKETIKAEAIGNYSTDANTYYNGITATSGKQLAAQLHDLITSTHRYYTSYDDNGKNLYQQNTDQYYENGAKVNGYIYEFYSGAKWSNAWVPNNTGGYNREHCWCQSNSVNTAGKQMWGTSGGGSDMHHLRPVEKDLNSTRGNHPYGEIDGRSGYERYPKKSDGTYSSMVGGYFKNGLDVFEPIDSKKGDVARIILYTYLHYNSYTISDLFGSYGTTDGNSNYSAYFSTSLLSLTKITNQTTESKAVEMLLKWNTNDPVDDIERRRNEQVATYQGNRNPFIDNSTYADAIWGNSIGITSISKTSVSLTTGETATIKAVSSNGANIKWTTSNSSVCSISSDTSASNADITLTASGVGSATITAKVTISGTTYSKTCDVTVSAPKTLASISASGQKITFTKGSDFEFDGVVTATYEDSSTANVTPKCTFTGYDLSVLGDQTVTISYTEGSKTKTTSYIITVKDSSIPEGDATLYSGALTEGYYVIYYNGKAMKNTVSSNRLDYSSVTPVNDVISSPDSSIVWHIEPSGDYWTIYNSAVDKYAAGNGTKNQGALIDSIDDKSKWTVTGTSTYEFVNKNNSSSSVNANLRNNGTYGFACYSASTGGALSLYRVNEGSAVVLSSISLDTTNVQKIFTVGDTFNYDRLVVTAHYSDESYEELDSYDVTAPSLATTGNKDVTVSYKENGVTKTSTYQITVNAQAPTSISATANKTFYVGEAITKSDISVEDNLGNEIDSFTFLNNNYQFTYSDASSGGSLTNKTFASSITYLTFTCSLTVQVQRKARESVGSVDDELNRTFTGITGTTYSDWSDKAGSNSSAIYAGNSAGGNESIQLRSNNSNSGIVSTASGGTLTKVTVTWNSNTSSGRTLNVYGKNTAYSAATDLYNTTNQGTLLGTIVCGTSTELTISDSYTFVGVRSASGAMYLTNITFTYGSEDSATNVANFIMYEDTDNQCLTKITTSKGYFEGLTSAERNTFMTSSDYVISTARKRLEAWARHQGKTIDYVNGDYSISNTSRIPAVLNSSINNTTIIVVVIVGIAVIAIGGYFLLRKKKVD